MAKRNPGDPIVIKKYANRRLYDTSTSSYVTLEHLSRLIRDGADFVVQDAKSGEDLTRSVLTQIIFEEESKGTNLLPVNFLRQVISFYGDQMQGVLPAYLDMSMNTFAAQQEKWRENLRAMGGVNPMMSVFEETAKRNMAMFEAAMSMFSPRPVTGRSDANESGAEQPETSPSQAPDDALSVMQQQLAAMQAQLESLAKKDK